VEMKAAVPQQEVKTRITSKSFFQDTHFKPSE
jgi:hypothetical protein